MFYKSLTCNLSSSIMVLHLHSGVKLWNKVPFVIFKCTWYKNLSKDVLCSWIWRLLETIHTNLGFFWLDRIGNWKFYLQVKKTNDRDQVETQIGNLSFLIWVFKGKLNKALAGYPPLINQTSSNTKPETQVLLCLMFIPDPSLKKTKLTFAGHCRVWRSDLRTSLSPPTSFHPFGTPFRCNSMPQSVLGRHCERRLSKSNKPASNAWSSFLVTVVHFRSNIL